MKTLIKGGNVVFENEIKKADLLIENGKIAKIGQAIEQSNCETINATGLAIMPGLVDMHVHLRDPGFSEKETIETGCCAAAAGGVTTVCCMPNTKPVADSEEIIEYIKIAQKKAKINVLPIAAITIGLNGKKLTNFKKLKAAGAIGFSDDGNPVEDCKLMEQAMVSANLLDVPIISHCEDLSLSKNGVVNEGKISRILNVKGSSHLSEEKMVEREINLAKKTGCKLHIAHVSTKKSVELIKKAKYEKISVTAETCPHYFMLCEEELLKKDANFKMNPPLRTEEDRKAIEEAVINDIIDIVVTDHAPHQPSVKKDLISAPNGVIGLETLLACSLTRFYHEKKLSLNKITQLLSTRTCKILNISGGRIEKNATADLVLVDLNKQWTVCENCFLSKSRNSPFIGKTLTGKVIKTFCEGNLVFSLA